MDIKREDYIEWHNSNSTIVKTSNFSEGLVRIARMTGHSGMKWGYINTEGKEVIPCIYKNAGDFHDGLAYVCKDKKYGYIDKQGKEVIPCVYESAGDFSEGLALAKLDGKYFIINKNLEKIEIESSNDTRILADSFYESVYDHITNDKNPSSDKFGKRMVERFKKDDASLKKYLGADELKRIYTLNVDGKEYNFSSPQERDDFENQLVNSPNEEKGKTYSKKK